MIVALYIASGGIALFYAAVGVLVARDIAEDNALVVEAAQLPPGLCGAFWLPIYIWGVIVEALEKRR